MVFPTVRCQKALLAMENSSAEAAMEWLFAHMDVHIDAPIQTSTTSSADMGFTPSQVKKALRGTVSGNAERAVEWLFSHPDDTREDGASSSDAPASASEVPGSKVTPARFKLHAFISHKGLSVHSGHYVAHIREGEDWVLFNDEKVVKADAESVRGLKRLAYLYVFKRV
ncbi:hypothetical protein BDQ17DRAFT_1365082 [Cyathus striatus]|nr:hypothetical protein BDQ17DRAFT_1365082 [Cyathus striatus]